jgi:hypothetical protein
VGLSSVTVAGATRLAQSRSFPIGAGQPVVDVDAVYRHTERCEAVSLGGEVLSVGGDPGVADLESAHQDSVPVIPPSPAHITEPVLRDTSSCSCSVPTDVDRAVPVEGRRRPDGGRHPPSPRGVSGRPAVTVVSMRPRCGRSFLVTRRMGGGTGPCSRHFAVAHASPAGPTCRAGTGASSQGRRVPVGAVAFADARR